MLYASKAAQGYDAASVLVFEMDSIVPIIEQDGCLQFGLRICTNHLLFTSRLQGYSRRAAAGCKGRDKSCGNADPVSRSILQGK